MSKHTKMIGSCFVESYPVVPPPLLRIGIEAKSTKYELALSKLSAVMMIGSISGIILEGFYSPGL